MQFQKIQENIWKRSKVNCSILDKQRNRSLAFQICSSMSYSHKVFLTQDALKTTNFSLKWSRVINRDSSEVPSTSIVSQLFQEEAEMSSWKCPLNLLKQFFLVNMSQSLDCKITIVVSLIRTNAQPWSVLDCQFIAQNIVWTGSERYG